MPPHPMGSEAVSDLRRILVHLTSELPMPAVVDGMSGPSAGLPPHGEVGVKGKDSAAHEQYSSGCFGIQGLSPIARPGRFLARSTSHPLVVRSDCTKILLAAAGLKRTRPFCP